MESFITEVKFILFLFSYGDRWGEEKNVTQMFTGVTLLLSVRIG